MIISPHLQQTVEWMQARAGIPTASEFDNLVSPTGEVREGRMPQTYMHQKLAEWWCGGPIASLNVFDMEQGKVLEEEAIPWYELEYGEPIQRVGLITTDDSLVGCSPDGLLGDNSGIEIKCPAIHTHIGYLMAGVLPPEYRHQVQGCLYVTGRESWKFVSYRRRLPALVLTVKPEEKYQMAIAEALERFIAAFDKAKDKLIAINGGPPKRPAKPTPKPAFVSDQNDFTP